MEENAKKLILTGAETFGAVIGGAVGLLGGPVAVLGGSALGVVVARGLSEFANRVLSNKEQARVGAATGLTVLDIKKRLDERQVPRDDDFFTPIENNRSKAEELFEGILLKCKNEYEEKKIKYVSNIYGNVVFDESVNPENVNQILFIAQQLTYRQLLILALIGQNKENKFDLLDSEMGYRSTPELLIPEREFVLNDFFVLVRLFLIERKDNGALVGISDVAAGLMGLTSIGKETFRLMNLETVPEAEYSFIGLIKKV